MSAPDDAARQATVPATAMQESMWWIHHRAKIKSVYNLTWRLACASAVDPAALAAAWQAVHDRHDALRGGLTQQDGSVGMFIEPAVLAAPERVVVADPGPASPDTLLELIAGELHDRPFQLGHPPLTRLALVTVAGRQELIVTVHHSMIDGWGLQLLLTDLSAAYAAARGAAPSSPPVDPVSFADYCRRSHAAQTDGRWQAGPSTGATRCAAPPRPQCWQTGREPRAPATAAPCCASYSAGAPARASRRRRHRSARRRSPCCSRRSRPCSPAAARAPM